MKPVLNLNAHKECGRMFPEFKIRKVIHASRGHPDIVGWAVAMFST